MMPMLPLLAIFAVLPAIVFTLVASTLVAAAFMVIGLSGSVLANGSAGRGSHAGADHRAFSAAGFMAHHRAGRTAYGAPQSRIAAFVKIRAAKQASVRLPELSAAPLRRHKSRAGRATV